MVRLWDWMSRCPACAALWGMTENACHGKNGASHVSTGRSWGIGGGREGGREGRSLG